MTAATVGPRPEDAIEAVTNHKPIPFAPPQPPAAPVSQAQCSEPTVDDVDRLWDWVRSDREGTTGFLSKEHANSRTFFDQINDFTAREIDGAGWFRSIRLSDLLVGFVMVQIINDVGSLALYVVPQSRHALPLIVPAILGALETTHPSITLVAVASFEDIIESFEHCGFTRQTVLTRPATR